ncbi:MAG: hypothetical protein JXR12_01440 [Neptunomonas phycophila]|uniref:hypothetical protein n=1 Tax=Neptunomonas phycophila TaxID=1572645 RepID=UPI003B8C158C
MSKSTQRKFSRYVQGGTTDSSADKLGFWDRKELPKSDTDEVITLDPKYQHAPWLLAFDKYGSVELMWFIFQYNNILDPATEFVAGVKIRLPTNNRLHIELLANRPEV